MTRNVRHLANVRNSGRDVVRPLEVDRFSEIVCAIYDAPFDDPPWEQALDNLRELLDASYLGLILRPPSVEMRGLMVHASGCCDIGGASSYDNHYHLLDPFAGLRMDEAVTVGDLIDPGRWEEHPFFREFLEPRGIAHVLAADMMTPDGTLCRLRACRPEQKENFGKQEIRLANLAIPHIRRAVRIQFQIRTMDSERRFYSGTLDRMMIGTIVLDSEGGVLQINPIAQDLLKLHPCLSVRDGELRCSIPAINHELQRILAKNRAPGCPMIPGIADAISIPATSVSGALGLLVKKIPFPERLEGRRQPAVAVFLRDPEHSNPTSVEIVRHLFDFTVAEANLALKLSNGLTLDEAAAELGIRRNTARAHLRSIFSKTGVSRQTTLIRVIINSVASL